MNESVIERITAILRDQFDAVLPESGVSADTEFEELGVDSLVLVELSLILQREYGVPVAEEELVAGGTLGAAAAIVTGRAAHVG